MTIELYVFILLGVVFLLGMLSFGVGKLNLMIAKEVQAIKLNIGSTHINTVNDNSTEFVEADAINKAKAQVQALAVQANNSTEVSSEVTDNQGISLEDYNKEHTTLRVIMDEAIDKLNKKLSVVQKESNKSIQLLEAQHRTMLHAIDANNTIIRNLENKVKGYEENIPPATLISQHLKGLKTVKTHSVTPAATAIVGNAGNPLAVYLSAQKAFLATNPVTARDAKFGASNARNRDIARNAKRK